MGCNASSTDVPPVVAFNTAVERAHAAPIFFPSSADGKKLHAKLNADLCELKTSIQVLNYGANTDYVRSSQIILASNYFTSMCCTDCPMREYKTTWLKFSFPDNGHWKVGEHRASGITVLVGSEKLAGLTIIFSMGTMSSPINASEYAALGQSTVREMAANGGPGFSGVVGLTNELSWMSEISECSVSGLECRQWFQTMRLTVPRAGHSVTTETKAMEVRGVRHEPREEPVEESQAPKKKSYFYGFNISANAQSAEHFNKVLPCYRKIIATVEFASADQCERQMGTYWTATGRGNFSPVH